MARERTKVRPKKTKKKQARQSVPKYAPEKNVPSLPFFGLLAAAP
jgi:hypothetical protein